VYLLVKIAGYSLSAKFDVDGNSLESYPGWYNWPVDMLIGGQGQVRSCRHYFTFLGKARYKAPAITPPKAYWKTADLM
jgi:hypothetical protein